MKVAVITYSNAQNYGAQLQAYALTEYLKKCGHSAKLIDYRPFDSRWFKPRKTASDIFFTAFLCRQGKRRVERFLRFRQSLPLTALCTDSGDLAALNADYDVFISGSDQVWNCNTRVNDDFFLRFVDNKKRKIAYAASFGSSSIPEEHREKVSVYIRDFDFVSVRERSGAELIRFLTGTLPPVVSDPVFLADRAEWETLIPIENRQTKPYLFVYTTEVSDTLERIVQTAHQKTGLPVLSTQHIPHCGCIVKKDIGPIEFLQYIRGAVQVISTSFHATAFSVIFEKNFCVVPHSQTGARVKDLLDDLGLYGAIVTDSGEWREKYQFPWEITRDILKEKKRASEDYLRDALTGEMHD